ncbi:MAG: carbamoyl phosphate synthase small subunit [Clostridia bacterium]|nr:carbamoyl phosphate synthase small subunit [Clostridia bacterium]
MEKARYLLLENGMVFKGKAFGADSDITGEVVFTTAMTGYLETLTDPSYYGQIVVQTFPLIGNYGVIPQDFESRKSFVKGYIVRDWCQEPSNFREQGDLDTFLREQGVPGLYGIDTRALTKIVRENGVMNGILLDELPEEMAPLLEKIKAYTITEAVKNTSTTEKVRHPYDEIERPAYDINAIYVGAHIRRSDENATGTIKNVVLMDLGAKYNIARELQKRGCDVTVVPYDTKAEEILAMKPDGIMLSNGPGDPAENVEVIAEIKKLRESGVPMFGICLGHQLLALSSGARTEKMKYGHRGANQPAKRLEDGRVFITSQNHGYCVVGDSLPDFAQVSFTNANDSTCEGVRYTDKPVFSVQFHPEASAGPLDSGFLFDDFVALMEEVSVNAVK